MPVQIHTFDPDFDLTLVLIEKPPLDVKNRELYLFYDRQLVDDWWKPDMIKYHLQVSSKHLILASKPFRVMLQSPYFAEGEALRSGKGAEVQLPDDEPSLPLQPPLFSDSKHEPREIRQSIKMLLEISILVDKYMLEEAAVPFAKLWMQVLPRAWSVSCPKIMVAQLYIAWAFKLDTFHEWAQSVVRRTSEEEFEKAVDMYDGILMLPDHLLKGVSNKRSAILDKAMNVTRTWIKSIEERFRTATKQIMDTNEILRLSSEATGSLNVGKGRVDISRSHITDTAEEKMARSALTVDRETKSKYHGMLFWYEDPNRLVQLVVASYEGGIFPLPEQITLKFDDYVARIQCIYTRGSGSLMTLLRDQAVSMEDQVIGVDLPNFKPSYSGES
ncbi:hypothetical protein GLAREA_09746 [Glarea lozoyensis ATCC 20868]|uniref:Uncharacterized protein n=1 Tax=Glarea lozoyensis (strain ATCC 20868 / MF5171) TaxID=1116229 RepID=S3CSI3_GLAL2|nr:uncharacterized protein GLAREA_09746 [Glarea lozoyensis ATCC 20868]EPE28625.1 hypothetical protein GLAREA_09746 [Glarea lozoyensis ATCC 20868]